MRAPRDELEHRVGDLARHLLGAVRPGIDVAMEAGLVAAIADIDLQRVEPAAAERRKGNGIEQRQHVAHGRSSLGAPNLGPQMPRAGGRRHPAADNIGTNRREATYRSQRGRHRRFQADAAVARQLQPGMAQVEPGHQAEQIDLDALDPADLDARRARAD